MFCSAAINAQVTANVYEQVLIIRVGGEHPNAETGTAFTYEDNGRQYLITAKHVVARLNPEDSVEYQRAGQWIKINVHVFKCDNPTDIAVLVPPYQLTTAFPLSADASKIYYGQDVYFLGFPYAFTLNGTNVNGTLPLPFIKRALYSGTVPLDPNKHSVQLLLDGYNNPGFSGAPIVYRDPGNIAADFKLVGVVSGFHPEMTEVMKKRPLRNREEASRKAQDNPYLIGTNPDGSIFEYEGTDTFIAANSGIIMGFAIFPALDLIHAHAIGPVVDIKKMDFPPGR
jgi:Trypsin-like peptidase domain